MSKKQSKWDILTQDNRSAYLNSIIDFFAKERDEEIGLIAAETILDFVLELVGKEIYNRGLEDANKLIKQRLADLEVELNLLKQDN